MGAELVDRILVACRVCGWVHYLMTTAEKAVHDRSLMRYRLGPSEWKAYELEFRQCLRCESPSQMFRSATAQEVSNALDHIVTPIIIEAALFDS